MPGIPEFEKKAVLFLVKFFAIYAVLQFLILALPLEFFETGIAGIEAAATGGKAYGNMIELHGHSFQIVPNCTGLVGISVLASIIFALRRPKIKKKIALLAVGAAILFPLNLLRVYFVLSASILFSPGIAEALHIATWFLVAGAILAIWYYLTKRIAKVKNFPELL